MSQHAVKVLGISITILDKEKILEQTKKYFADNAKLKHQKSEETVKPFIIFTPNSEQIVYAQKDKHFFELINQADITLPDGIGVVYAAKFLDTGTLNRKITDKLNRIAGVEFMQNLVKQGIAEGHAIGLIGGRDGLAVKAFECLRQKHPHLRGWGADAPEASVLRCTLKLGVAHNTSNGLSGQSKPQSSVASVDPTMGVIVNQYGEIPVETYMDRFVREVSRSRTDILFVGMGAPKQEYFVEQFIEAWLRIEKEMKRRIQPDIPLVELHPLIIMVVGGSFDIIIGKTPRAPVAMQKRGLEWLWRLISEPWRIRRQLALFTFILYVIRERFRK